MTSKRGNFKKGGNLPESNMKETIKTITETPINNLTSINNEYLEEDKFSGLKRFLFWFVVIIFLLLIIGYILKTFYDVDLIKNIQEFFYNIKNFFNNLTKNNELEDDIEDPEQNTKQKKPEQKNPEQKKPQQKNPEQKKPQQKTDTEPSLKELKSNLDNNINTIKKNIDDYQDKYFDNSLEKELVNKKLFNYKDTKTNLSDNETAPEPVSSDITGPGFCYIGTINNTRFCAPVTNKNKCMSGEIFPSIDICINPNVRKGS